MVSLQKPLLGDRWWHVLLRLRIFLSETIRPTELQVTLFWAGIIGFVGACTSVGFRKLTEGMHWMLTGQAGGYVESFMRLSTWQRLMTPAMGGILAGLTLLLGTRWSAKRNSTDFMEAVVLGDGIVPLRLSLVKCISAMFSIASGASIGREGPLVQLSVVGASLIGRVRNTPTLQLRLLVACGAAAGIASAYNAPIGGALFVAEIVLQSLAMETFGPLVFSSVVATLTVQQLFGEHALYEIPPVRLSSSWEILPHMLLGVFAGLTAPWFLRLLRASERCFAKLPLPTYLRLGLGGLIVGALAVFHPEVCGNGYSVVNQILHGGWLWQSLVLILALKVVATSATFGSGAVGGVFTPTLFCGACLGWLVGHGAQSVWPGTAMASEGFTVVGMGAFLAATTHAPIMAIIMIFELTLDYGIILPLMLACVIAHYTSGSFEKKSIYYEALKRKGGGTFRERFSALRVADLMKPNPIAITENTRFRAITESFVLNRFDYLYVTDTEGNFKGVISLHDIKSYLNSQELAELVIARDIMQERFPTLTPGASLTEALDRFVNYDGERLPITLDSPTGKLVGTLSKTDLILAMAERAKPSRGSTDLATDVEAAL